MYLMTLTNSGYIVITIFFALMFLIAYQFRNKNKHSEDILGLSNQEDYLRTLLGNFGVLEVVLAGCIAAMIGFSSIYYLIIGILFALTFYFILQQVCNKFNSNDFNSLLTKRLGRLNGIVWGVFSAISCLILLLLIIILTFKALQSLLGWSYINSIVGLIGLTLICLLTGGYKAVYYNKLLQLILALSVFIVTLGFALYNSGGIAPIYANLRQLALSRNLADSYYLSLTTNHTHILSALVITITGVCGLTALYYYRGSEMAVKQNVLRKLVFASIVRIIICGLMLCGGVIAVGSSIATNTLSGENIVTIEAQLPDGQTGYIVKSIDEGQQKILPIPGIIPPIINPETNLTLKNHYDYSLANIILVKHYLPQELGNILVVMLMALFMFSFSDYIIIFTRIVVSNILVNWSLVKDNGTQGKLWACRLTVLTCGISVLFLAYFALTYFDLLQFIYILIAVFLSPIFAISLLLFWLKPYVILALPLIVALVVALNMVHIYTNVNLLEKYALITAMNFIIVFLGSLVLNLFCSRQD